MNENYGIQTEYPKRPQTREYAPDWDGITTEHPYYRNTLIIGEFAGDGGFYKERIDINWGDGTTDTIWFDCDLIFVKKSYPPKTKAKRRIWLKTPEEPDGKLVNDNGLTLTIVK